MGLLEPFFSEEMMSALGWTVLHSFWQAAALALLMAVLQVALREHRAYLRYWLAVGTLLGVLIAAVVTFGCLYQAGGESSAEPTVLTTGPDYELVVGAEPTVFQAFAAYFNQHIPLVVSIWLIGASLFLLRMLGGLVYLGRLRSRHLQPVGPLWEQRKTALADRLGLDRPVALFESALVKVPMVLGYLKPVILLPAGALIGLSPSQLEAVLAHELAHIQRNDYLLNLIQTVIEILFYFNPAVWMISAYIRTERENCCDDIAVDLCGNSLTYAKALVSLQEMSSAAPSLAMAFSKRNDQLLNRIRRILNQPQNQSNIMEKLIATLLLLSAFLFIAASAPTDEKPADTSAEPSITIDWIEPSSSALDTIIPGKNAKDRHRIIKRENGKTTEVLIEDGVVRELIIDGEPIPEPDFPKYKEETEALLSEGAPEPPMPPTPPTPPVAPNAPVPPAPPVAPVPPAPPTPPAAPKGKSMKVTTEALEGGAVRVWVQEPGTEAVEVYVDADHIDQLIVVDGDKFGIDENAFEFRSGAPFFVKPEGEAGPFFLYRSGEDARLLDLKKESEELKRLLDASKEGLNFRFEGLGLGAAAEDLRREWTALAEGDTAQRAEWIEAFKAKGENDHLEWFLGPDDRDLVFHSDYAFGFGQVRQAAAQDLIKQELQKDGFIQYGKFTFDLSEKRLRINGQKQPEAVFQKYLKLYREASGTKGDFRVQIKNQER